MADMPAVENRFLADHADLLISSYKAATGQSLLLAQEDDAAALYYADFVVLSHDTQADPVLTYANLRAQGLWEMGWDEITQMPSRLTAEPDERAARAALFEALRGHGFLNGYEGVRVSSSGRRFRIRDAVIWTLTDASGLHHGEAATFKEVEFL